MSCGVVNILFSLVFTCLFFTFYMLKETGLKKIKKTIRYIGIKLKYYEKQECVVCFNDFYNFELKKLKCGHSYDFDCYNKFKFTNKCPYCRQMIFTSFEEIVIEFYQDIKNTESIQDAIEKIISNI